MKETNPYESLRREYQGACAPVQTQSSYRVTDSNAESVTIFTSQLPEGVWAYGYQVYWADGRCSQQSPDPVRGVFATESEARLYCVGFMKSFSEFFRPATVDSLRSVEAMLLSPSLEL